MQLLISSIVLIFSFLTFIYVIDKLKYKIDDTISLFFISIIIPLCILLTVLKIVGLNVSHHFSYNLPTLNLKYIYPLFSIGMIYLHIKKFKKELFKTHIIFFILFSILSLYFNLNFGIIYFGLNVILPFYLKYRLSNLNDKIDYVIYKNALNVILNAVSILLMIGFNLKLYF